MLETNSILLKKHEEILSFRDLAVSTVSTRCFTLSNNQNSLTAHIYRAYFFVNTYEYICCLMLLTMI